MITLGIIVIDPILKLRQALIAVGEAPGEDNGNLACYSLGVKRQDELGEVMLTFNDMRHQISSYVRQIKEREKQLENLVMELGVARDRAEKLLLNILPDPIAEQLKQGVYPIAESFGQATVLFADLVGFTELAGHIPAVKLVELLNEIFSAFDQLADKHGLEKIKTIGDAYMVVGGIPTPRPDHAEAIAHMALDMQQEVRRLAALKSEALSIRIGIHTGPVIAGVIGIKKFIYDLWGDTVNIASRMESHGIAGCIQVSETTYHRLQQQFRFQSRGPIAIKGKGKMQTYLLIEKLNPTPDETPTHTKPSTRGTLEHLEILKPALEEEDLAN
jgi:class 3 adenylate cyclase